MDAENKSPDYRKDASRRSMQRIVRLVLLDTHWKARRRASGKSWNPLFWEYLPALPEVTGRDEWPAIPWSLTIWVMEKWAIIIQPNDKVSDAPDSAAPNRR